VDLRAHTFEEGRRTTEALLDLMRAHGLEVSRGSSLERMTLSIYDILSHGGQSYEREVEDVRQGFGDLASATELGIQLLSVRDHPEFGRLVPHLRLLDEGEASQTIQASPSDQASNKIFELLTACYAMRCGTDVELDDPQTSAGGKNPDVLVTMEDQRWGIACKVLHSIHPEAIIANVEKGLIQIDASPAETGFLFLSLKNVVDRDRLWTITNEKEWGEGAAPRFSAFSDFTDAQTAFEAEIDRIVRIMVDSIGQEILRGLFKGHRALSGILFYAHVVCGVVVSDQPVATSIRFPTWASLQGTGNAPQPMKCFHKVIQATPPARPRDA